MPFCRSVLWKTLLKVSLTEGRLYFSKMPHATKNAAFLYLDFLNLHPRDTEATSIMLRLVLLPLLLLLLLLHLLLVFVRVINCNISVTVILVITVCAALCYAGFIIQYKQLELLSLRPRLTNIEMNTDT